MSEAEVKEEIVDDAENDNEEKSEEETADEENQEEQSEEEDGPLIVSFGDDEPDEHEEAPAWVKEVRASNRELKRKLKDAENSLKERDDAKEQSTLGDKPKLEDFEYDAEKFEPALLEWHNKKSTLDKQKTEQQDQAKKQEEEWAVKKTKYTNSKAELNVEDFDVAEDVVVEKLSELQQNIIIAAADDPTKFVYGLGKNSTALDKLASTTDPIKFAVEIGRMEAQMKTRTGKRAPKPETKISGDGAGGSSNKTLEKLETEAAKTGDRTKIVAYKREQKKAS